MNTMIGATAVAVVGLASSMLHWRLGLRERLLRTFDADAHRLGERATESLMGQTGEDS